MADKINLTKEFMNIATEMSDLAYRAERAIGMWGARSHGSGGSDEIEDSDISTLPITATQLQGLEYSLEHFLTFLDNGSPAQADHRANLEKGQNVEGEYTITLP